MTQGAPKGRRRRLLRAWIAGAPLWCSWQLTRRCSSLCLFCENRPLAAEEELDTAAMRRAIAELDRAGTFFVSLSGGEPFLRGDLAEIVAALAPRHVPLLTTHGWLMEPAKARDVWSAGLTAASVLLEHPRAEAHDERLGVKGAHARALSALGVLAGTRSDASRQKVNLKVRVRGADDVPALAPLAEEVARHGATLSVEPAYPVATGAAPGLGPALLELKRAHASVRSSEAYLGRFDEAMAGGVPRCRAGRTFFNVDHRGRVTHCVEFGAPQHEAGDLTRDRIEDVLGRLREKTEGNACQRCWSASRGEMESLYGWRAVPAVLGTLWRG